MTTSKQVLKEKKKKEVPRRHSYSGWDRESCAAGSIRLVWRNVSPGAGLLRMATTTVTKGPSRSLRYMQTVMEEGGGTSVH